MGGTVSVVAGDFTQQTVVVDGSSSMGAAEGASILGAMPWGQVQRLVLVKHFRAAGDAEYGRFVDRVGLGLVEPVRVDDDGNMRSDLIRLPRHLFRHATSEDELLSWVYPDPSVRRLVSGRAVLAMTNDEVNRLNEIMLQRLKVDHPAKDVPRPLAN